MTSKKIKPNMTFMERYNADDKYRQKHLKYMSEKISCPECDVTIARNGLSRHKQTQKHLSACNNKDFKAYENLTIKDIYKRLNRLKAQLKAIK